MVTLVTSIADLYNHTMSLRDTRLDGWFLMDSPWPLVSIVAFYIYFCKWLGPRLMKRREPFEIRRFLIFYNAVMVLWSAYLLYEFLQSGWGGQYSFRCQPVDYTTTPIAMRMVRAGHLYLVTKLVELADTVFFVLRKKFGQVSNLHLIHHALMPLNLWLGLRFVAGGHSSFFLPLNCFIHVVMYLYYGLSALGPRYQKYLWWKRYLTVMQICQFLIIFVHNSQLLFIDCNYPKLGVYWIEAEAIMFIFMFGGFYRGAYVGRGQRKGGHDALDKKNNPLGPKME